MLKCVKVAFCMLTYAFANARKFGPYETPEYRSTGLCSNVRVNSECMHANFILKVLVDGH